jgi:hypothetical protein
LDNFGSKDGDTPPSNPQAPGTGVVSVCKAALHAKLQQALEASWIGKLINGRRKNKVMDAGVLLAPGSNSCKEPTNSQQEQRAMPAKGLQRVPDQSGDTFFEQLKLQKQSLLLESPRQQYPPGQPQPPQQQHQGDLSSAMQQQVIVGGGNSTYAGLQLLPAGAKLLSEGSKSRGRLAPLQHNIER